MGKNERFEKCFTEYRDLVLRYVMDKTGDYQISQEICQQVFIAFYGNMDSVAEDMVKAWLLRCASNATVDYYRRRRVAAEIFEGVPLADTGNLVAMSTLDVCEERMIHKAFVGKILEKVRRENESWYEVLMLYCVEGLSYREISRRLEVPEAVLRARLHRARLYLRKNYGEEYENL